MTHKQEQYRAVYQSYLLMPEGSLTPEEEKEWDHQLDYLWNSLTPDEQAEFGGDAPEKNRTEDADL
jgi:hypothetical protein